MELEELGELLNNTTQKNTPNEGAASYKSTAGPLNDLAKRLKFTLVAFPLAAFLFTAQFIDNAAARHSPTKWLLVTVLFVEFLLALFSYGIVKSINRTEGAVKQNLLDKLSLMQRAYTLHLYLHLVLYVAMAIALELTMRYQLDLNFNGWSSINISVRVLVYTAFLVLQYFLKRISYKKYYGRYMERVKQLVLQLEY
jgi:hypothetical protein